MENSGHQLRVGRIRIGKVCGETESDIGGMEEKRWLETGDGLVPHVHGWWRGKFTA